MDLGLKGKIALVCGGSRGMGKAIAKTLAAEGASIALLARDEKQLEAASQEIREAGAPQVLALAVDLSRLDEIPKAVKSVKEKFKTVHILINNAGGPAPGNFESVSEADWEKALNQNLKSVITMTREVIPLMKSQKFGRIINITSQLVKEPPPNMVLSNTARAGVVAFAKSISHELASLNITVNTLCPGTISTDRLRSLVEKWAKEANQSPAAYEQELLKSVPMKRLGRPEEFAQVAAFLASEKASYITGTTIAVDGGTTKSLM